MAKSNPPINYDFVIQALAELSSQAEHHYPKDSILKYLYSLFSLGYNEKPQANTALEKLYTHPALVLDNKKIKAGFLTFISYIYQSIPVRSALEMELLAPHFKDLMNATTFKEIVKANKDSTYFNEHYKKEKALLSDSASTQDVIDLLEKMTRYKDLELPVKILAAYHSQTKGENQSIDLSAITTLLTEKIAPTTKNWRGIYTEHDSAGKLYRLLELAQLSTATIDGAYFGIKSGRPVYSEPGRYHSGLYVTSGVSSGNARKSLIALNHFWADKLFNNFYTPPQISELMSKVFDYDKGSHGTTQPKDSAKQSTHTMIRALVSFVQSQKTDLKTLSVVCPHIKAFFDAEKALGNFADLNSPQNSSSTEKSEGDAGIYWVLNFISNNATKIKEITGETSENILKALIKIENQKLSKSMAKVKEVPTDKPKHNKI